MAKLQSLYTNNPNNGFSLYRNHLKNRFLQASLANEFEIRLFKELYQVRDVFIVRYSF